MSLMPGLAELILQAQDIQEEIVEVPEWNVKVLVRGMTGAERARYLESVMEGTKFNIAKGYADLVLLCARDPETKEPIFQPSHRDALLQKSASALERIAKVALKLSGLTPEEQQALGNA